MCLSAPKLEQQAAPEAPPPPTEGATTVATPATSTDTLRKKTMSGRSSLRIDASNSSGTGLNIPQ